MAIQKTERIENIEVDINDTSLAEGIESELDLKEDWQAKAAPPPKGKYRMRLFLEDQKFEQGSKMGFKPDDPNGKFYKKTITCKIQDPTGKWQDYMSFYNVSTGIPRGKKVSTMAGLLAMLKVKVPVKATDLYIARLLVKAMEKLDGPTVIGDCDWSTWDKNADGRGDFGSALRVGMLNFPKNPDGTYNHIIYNKKGEEFVAKLKILKLFPLVQAAAPVANGAPAPVQQVAKPVVPIQTTMIPPTAPVVMEQGGGVTLDNDGEVILEM